MSSEDKPSGNTQQTNIEGDINTESCAFISGTVHTHSGDVAGRDIVHGDKIDQINITRLDPTNARNQRNHTILRKPYAASGLTVSSKARSTMRCSSTDWWTSEDIQGKL